MQNQIEPVLQMDDITKVFRVSVATVNRWLAASRRGLCNFPLPLSGPGRKLSWSKDAIEDYLARNLQPIACSKVGSVSQRRRRHEQAMSELETKDNIKIKKGASHEAKAR